VIGLFIGSFNPPTLAHLEICIKLKKSFNKIVLVPVNSNDKRLIDIKERINMLNILKNKYPFLEISGIMKNYSYLNFRIIDLLKKEYGDVNIIMGSDLFVKFSYFDNYEYLLNNYSFTIITRNQIDINSIINKKYFLYKNKFSIINYYSNISSTLVRDKIQKKEELKSVLDRDVYLYIKAHHLY